MADIVSPEKRSQNMSAIRSKNTQPEVYLRKLLFALDIIVFYCFCYYGGSFVVMTLKYCRKAIKLAKENEDKM